ncbi:MAG: tRNA (adenosine(37)-N6)-threonylcarbamoyltransferase complex transferase subunit TsaD [Nitrospinota bacterium]
MLVLGIETSCDETAVALVEDGRKVRASVVATQHEVHARFGGVVPELASRRHVENIEPVIRAALGEAGASLEEVDAVAVTRGPGLIIALLVGLSAAKALAYARGLPLVGVHHLLAHLHTPFLEGGIEFPFMGAVFSGGHTHLYRAENHGGFSLLGATLDDAAGEAFDKAAALLGLGYPGGPLIDRLHREFREREGSSSEPHPFPRPLLRRDSLDFSFSGLKTALFYFLREQGYYRDDPSCPPWERPGGCPPDVARSLAAGFQEAVVDVLVEKVVRAAEQEGLSRVVATGGVVCNRLLRSRLKEEAARWGWELFLPSPRYCTDNAAMVACAGHFLLKEAGPEAFRDYLDMDALPDWELSDATV